MTKKKDRPQKIQVSFMLNAVYSYFIALILTVLFQYAVNYWQLPGLDGITLIVLIGIFVGTFFLLTRRIVTDFVTLERGLQIIAEGDLDYRVPVERRDELGRVAANINLMAERLQEQIARERELEKSKMEMISGVSHDLRTPLTSIIGYIELLRANAFQSKEEYNRFIENTLNKSVHLKRMLDDLFEYTQLSSNEARLKLNSFDLSKLVGQLLFEFEPIALENDISLITKLGEKPIMIVADSDKIARAIDNLLMNALKYSTKPGTVEIHMTSNDTYVTLRIENKGQSLTKEQEQKIFERFYKADHSRSSEDIQIGAGLGLSITKNIMQLHGGDILLDHVDGHYKFSLVLPLA